MECNERLEALDALLDKKDGRVTTFANAAAFLFENTEGCSWAGFYLLSGGMLKLAPFTGSPARSVIDPAADLCGEALRARRLFNVPDVTEYPGNFPLAADHLSQLAVPLYALSGETLGVMLLAGKQKDLFSVDDEEFLTAAAKIIVNKTYGMPEGERLEQRRLLDYLSVAEKLKSVQRHCFTAAGMRETVAGHSWRIALMAMLLAPEFPAIDMDKVIRMCLIHDLGEAVTGDIPTFNKTEEDEAFEYRKLMEFTDMLPGEQNTLMKNLFVEMDALKTPEARFYKTLDKLEAVIQHNESDVTTWTSIEYELNLHYAMREASAFPWLYKLREEMLKDTKEKIADAEARHLVPAPASLFD